MERPSGENGAAALNFEPVSLTKAIGAALAAAFGATRGAERESWDEEAWGAGKAAPGTAAPSMPAPQPAAAPAPRAATPRACAATEALKRGPLPRHVALIMDGNGRWAQARGLPRLAGHRQGVERVREVVEACGELGIEALTLYAFSTENWRRPAAEVGGLMNLFRAYFEREVETLAARGVRVRFIGDRARFAPDIRAMMEATESRTAANDALTLAVAMNYGARAEIAAAARRLAAEVSAGDRALDAVDEAALTGALDTEGMPELDLMIRTSGEQRLSNFLLWQAAYAELVFAPETWPDFRRAALHRALQTYQARDRRFGAVAPGMAGQP